MIFGTFSLPAEQRPDRYGVDDPHFPKDFIGQIRHPFAPARSAGTRASSDRSASIGRIKMLVKIKR